MATAGYRQNSIALMIAAAVPKVTIRKDGDLVDSDEISVTDGPIDLRIEATNRDPNMSPWRQDAKPNK